MIEYKELLRILSFRKIFFSQVLNSLAAFLDFTAIMTLIAYEGNMGAYSIAVISIAYAIPGLLVSPLAGVIADRADRKRVMIYSTIFSILSILPLMTTKELWLIAGLIVIRGTARAFYSPANIASIRGTVPEDQLNSAFGSIETISHLSKIVSPALGAALLTAFPPNGLFAFSASLFLLSGLNLVTWKAPERIVRNNKAYVAPWKSIVQELQDGINTFKADRLLLIALGSMVISTYSIQMSDNLFVLLTKEAGMSASIYGMAVAAIGVGGVVGSLFSVKLGRSLRPLRMLSCAVFADAMCFIMFANLESFSDGGAKVAVFGIACTVMGVAIALESVAFTVFLNSRVDASQIGTAFGFSTSASSMSVLVAPVAGAAVAASFGLNAAFLCTGALMLIVAAIFAMHARRFEGASSNGQKVQDGV